MGKINLHNYEVFLIDYLDGNLNESAVAELKTFILANPQLEIDLEEMELPSFTDENIAIDFKNELKKTVIFIEDEELLNYLEGNLSLKERELFEAKLLNDKQLQNKLAAYQKTFLAGEIVAFAGKNALHKTEDEFVLSNVALSYVEGGLNAKEKLQFENKLKTNAALQKEVALFTSTRLIADTTLVFEDKEALKKEAKVIALFSFRTVASIAAAVLLLIGLAVIYNFYASKSGVEINELANNTKDSLKKENNTKANGDAINKPLNVIDNTPALIAKNVTNANNITIKKQNEIILNEQVTNSVIVNKQEENTEQQIDKQLNENNTQFANNNKTIDTTNAVIANTTVPKFSKPTYFVATETVDDEDNVVAQAPAKKGFWQRAVNLAKQANKLGVKSIDGEESAEKKYALSFNSFSVEKR